MIPFWHPLLSNCLVATESRRASCPLGGSLVQGNKGLSKLGIWLGSFLLFLQRVRSIPPTSASTMNDTGRFWSVVPIRQLGVAHFMDDATGFLAEFQSFLVFSDLPEKISCVSHILNFPVPSILKST